MTVKLAIHEIKDHLSSVIATLADSGEEVEISKHGRVVARLVPPRILSPSPMHLSWTSAVESGVSRSTCTSEGSMCKVLTCRPK